MLRPSDHFWLILGSVGQSGLAVMWWFTRHRFRSPTAWSLIGLWLAATLASTILYELGIPTHALYGMGQMIGTIGVLVHLLKLDAFSEHPDAERP